jgi:2-(1,2-epoxy-1,2-dihydrophenyl)acetyl-CoA isomerase
VTDSQPLLLDIADGIATLTLNRPDVGNSLDIPTANALIEHTGTLAARTDVRVVVIRAGGRLFCAGGDVRAMSAASDRHAFLAELADTIHRGLIALRALPIPIIVAIQGPAAGGGLGLVLAADIAVAVDTASFVAAYSAIGLSPDCGVTALLPGAVGGRRAALFALTNQPLSAAQALEWGLISESVMPDALEARVAELAQLLAARPGESAGQAARLLRRSAERSYADQLDDEAANIARLSITPEASALIDAFAAKAKR